MKSQQQPRAKVKIKLNREKKANKIVMNGSLRSMKMS